MSRTQRPQSTAWLASIAGFYVSRETDLTGEYQGVAKNIEDFRWHDLRDTWAGWLVQHGTPLNVAQEMGAWQSEEMVRRYAHLAPAHLAPHAEIVANPLGGTVRRRE